MLRSAALAAVAWAALARPAGAINLIADFDTRVAELAIDGGEARVRREAALRATDDDEPLHVAVLGLSPLLDGASLSATATGASVGAVSWDATRGAAIELAPAAPRGRIQLQIEYRVPGGAAWWEPALSATRLEGGAVSVDYAAEVHASAGERWRDCGVLWLGAPGPSSAGVEVGADGTAEADMIRAPAALASLEDGDVVPLQTLQLEVEGERCLSVVPGPSDSDDDCERSAVTVRLPADALPWAGVAAPGETAEVELSSS